jgi:hypothetical protein
MGSDKTTFDVKSIPKEWYVGSKLGPYRAKYE